MFVTGIIFLLPHSNCEIHRSESVTCDCTRNRARLNDKVCDTMIISGFGYCSSSYRQANRESINTLSARSTSARAVTCGGCVVYLNGQCDRVIFCSGSFLEFFLTLEVIFFREFVS